MKNFHIFLIIHCKGVIHMPDEKRSESVSEHIAGKADEVCSIVDGILSELQNRERLESAPLNQISSALGTLVDKFSKTPDEDGSGELTKIFSDFKDIK